MRLFAVRHGEAKWNLERREMGQLDSPLTTRGIAQAQALASRLRDLKISALYSSDLGRAVQTGEIIAEACALALQIDPGLRERNMGIFQGLTVEEMRTRYPRERADYERIGFDYVIPDGESARQRLERSVRILTAIAKRHPGEQVAAVTHGGFLMGFFEFVLGIGPGNGTRFRRHNASFNAFEYIDGAWALETWNDLGHLERLGSSDDPMLADRYADPHRR